MPYVCMYRALKRLCVMPHKVPQAVPSVGVAVDVRHAAAQARLQLSRVLVKQIHHHAPADAGKDRPGVVANGGAGTGLRHAGEAVAGLDGQPRQREHDSRKDVDDDLLVDARHLARAPRPLAKDEVAAQQAGHEGVIGACEARGLEVRHGVL